MMIQLNDHLIEIVDRLGRIEAKQDFMREALDSHKEADAALKAEVDEIKIAVAQGHAKISLLKWLVAIGVALATALSKFVR